MTSCFLGLSLVFAPFDEFVAALIFLSASALYTPLLVHVVLQNIPKVRSKSKDVEIKSEVPVDSDVSAYSCTSADSTSRR